MMKEDISKLVHCYCWRLIRDQQSESLAVTVPQTVGKSMSESAHATVCCWAYQAETLSYLPETQALRVHGTDDGRHWLEFRRIESWSQTQVTEQELELLDMQLDDVKRHMLHQVELELGAVSVMSHDIESNLGRSNAVKSLPSTGPAVRLRFISWVLS